mgnify:CR=1 FL=1|jgi:histidinol-phosphate phosphatase family protein
MSVLSKIVFLDRDGVINKLRKDYVKNLSEFEIILNVGKNLAKLSKNGFKIIVITNQSAINRNLLTTEELKKIHEFMINELHKDGCVINRIYYCPHRPDENCDCRKPKIALFKKALVEFFPSDLKNSWMIGDSQTDLEAANSCGIKGIKINSDQDIQIEIDKILSS